MTDQTNVQQQEIVEEKQQVNNVNVGQVPNTGTPVVTQRPTFLTVLCILTFIGSGLSVIGALFTSVFSGVMEAIGAQLPSELSMFMPDTGLFVGLIILLAAVASFVGAIKMWKLQKVGFAMYVIAQAVMLVSDFGLWSLVFTGLFIGLYAMNLKYMK